MAFALKDLSVFLDAVTSQVTGILNTLTGANDRITDLTQKLTDASTQNVQLAKELVAAVAAKAADNSAAQAAATQAAAAHDALVAELAAIESATAPTIKSQVESLAEKLGIDLAEINPTPVPS